MRRAHVGTVIDPNEATRPQCDLLSADPRIEREIPDGVRCLYEALLKPAASFVRRARTHFVERVGPDDLPESTHVRVEMQVSVECDSLKVVAVVDWRAQGVRL